MMHLCDAIDALPWWSDLVIAAVFFSVGITSLRRYRGAW